MKTLISAAVAALFTLAPAAAQANRHHPYHYHAQKVGHMRAMVTARETNRGPVLPTWTATVPVLPTWTAN